MNWYTVEIGGRYDGRPRTVRATVQAASGGEAVDLAVADEFGVEYVYCWYGTSPRGQKVLCFSGENEDEWVYCTDHATFEEMVCEVTDAVAVARLTGHPTLPLVME